MSTISDTMPDFSGYILNRQYHLQDLLGAGTYGVVYKALDTLASIPHPTYRAIKIMRKSSDRKFDDIQREITLHHAVSHHRGVVRLHGAFDDKRYVFVTEAQLLPRWRPLQPDLREAGVRPSSMLSRRATMMGSRTAT